MLDASLDDITQNLQQRDLDGLVANRRFLEERFATENPGLDGVPGIGTARRSSGSGAIRSA